MKYPIGIQTFAKIREENFLYFDKTKDVYQLAKNGGYFFLSRPRRFGKSLLVTTLEAYFQGRKELFEGLAISKLETEWEQYPVLHIDLNAADYRSEEALISIIDRHIRQFERTFGKDPDEHTVSERFKGVIQRACEQTGRQVVILVDEYDKPLLQAIGNEELQDNYRKILKGFYGVAKTERHTSDGRMDMLVQTADYIYIFEFKLDKSADEALAQIDENQYALPFATDPRKLYKIGVNFSSETRRVESWKVVER